MNSTTNHRDSLAQKYFSREWEKLSEYEQRVLHSITERTHVSRNIGAEADDRSFGQRLADRIAAFGGSWTFIMIFMGILLAWVTVNTILVARTGTSFDPYPFILLNLFLSMLAALQAPVIMMSQNRQSAKDRLDAAHDYEVNLKAELEIVRLHEKIDELREEKWENLVRFQQEQIDLLHSLCRASGISVPEE